MYMDVVPFDGSQYPIAVVLLHMTGPPLVKDPVVVRFEIALVPVAVRFEIELVPVAVRFEIELVPVAVRLANDADIREERIIQDTDPVPLLIYALAVEV